MKGENMDIIENLIGMIGEKIMSSSHPELLELSDIQTETTVKIIRLADKYGIDRNKLMIQAVRGFTDVLLGNDYSEFVIPGEDDKEATK